MTLEEADGSMMDIGEIAKAVEWIRLDAAVLGCSVESAFEIAKAGRFRALFYEKDLVDLIWLRAQESRDMRFSPEEIDEHRERLRSIEERRQDPEYKAAIDLFARNMAVLAGLE